MILRLFVFFSVVCCALLNSCDQSDSPTEQKPAQIPPSPDAGQSSQVAGSPKNRGTEGTTPQNEFPPILKRSFEQMRRGAPKVPSMLKAWKGLWSGPFDEKTIDPSIEAKEGKKIASDVYQLQGELKGPIFEHLKQGNSLAGFSRMDLVGICSIYIGWANDPTTSNQLHDLFLHRSNSLPQTLGDAVVLLATDEVLNVIEPPKEFTAENFKLWIEVANGSNPIYRQVALKVFPKIERNTDRLAEFYSVFQAESDQAVKEELLLASHNLPEDSRLKFLEALKIKQTEAGDLEFARRIDLAIGKLR